jgi:hypothetical protein
MTCSTGISNLRLCYHTRINIVITRLSIELKLKGGLSTTFPGSGPLPGCAGLAVLMGDCVAEGPETEIGYLGLILHLLREFQSFTELIIQFQEEGHDGVGKHLLPKQHPACPK